MSKTSKQPSKKISNNTTNTQEKLNQATNSVSSQTVNHSHNTKKESLGPNTKR